MVALGIETERHLEFIALLKDHYLRVQVGLLDGDPELGLHHPKERSRIMKSVWDAEKHWDADYGPPIEHVIATKTLSEKDAYELFDHDEAMIHSLHVMVSEVVDFYANPNEMLMSDAMTLEILARQEFMAAAIGKEVCLLHLGYHSDLHREKLVEELAAFEASHFALVDGIPGMGLKPAPTPEIRTQLGVFKSHWDDLMPDINNALTGEMMSKDDLLVFSDAVIDLLYELDHVIELYENR